MLQPRVDGAHVHQPQEGYDQHRPDNEPCRRAKCRSPDAGHRGAGHRHYVHEFGPIRRVWVASWQGRHSETRFCVR